MASVPFNNLITFSRGSNATLTGPDGLIQYAPNNLFTNSESFDNAAWTKSNATVTANATTAPDGTTTADTLIENTATGTHVTFQVFTFVAATAYTYSAYVKANGRTKFDFASLSGFSPGASFDLTAVTATPLGATSAATITAVGNGWYRCTATRTSAGGSDQAQIRLVDAAGASTYTGDGTSGIFVWGAQLELGSAATTYNSTTVKNLLGFSEAFDNAAWTKSNASIVTGAQANPVNGAFNAQKLMEDTSTNLHRVSQVPTLTAAAHTASIYAKSAGRNWLYMANASLSQAAYFNLNTGTIGTIVGAATATITSVGNGWYRCSITSTPSAGAQNYSFYTANADASFSYTGDGNSGIYIYGAQLSDSASLDPYVPTPAAAPSSTAYYGPRFDYDPVTLAPKGLLVEEARTNLLTYSEQFDNAAWQKAAATATANATTAPDGTSTADKVVATATTAFHGVFQAPTGTVASYTYSVYAKAAEYSKLQIANSTAGTWAATFDLATGATISTGGAAVLSSAIQSVGNGWYRCSIAFTGAAIPVAHAMMGYPNTGATLNNFGVQYTGDGVSGVFLWGAQLEAGAFATSYIPTVASTVTRSADVATISGSLFSQWYGQSAGTIVASVDTVAPTGSTILSFQDGAGASTNRQQMNVYTTCTATVVGGVTQSNMGINTSAAVNLAYAYKANDFAASANGGTVATDTSGTVPTTLAYATLGKWDYGTAASLNGHIRSVNFIPARAADFQLQVLST
jgi:hypothetical protein